MRFGPTALPPSGCRYYFLLLCSPAIADSMHGRSTFAEKVWMAKDTMLNDWHENDNDVASGSSCPIPECGALAVTFGPKDNGELCEFTCPRCGSDFIASSDALIFHSVPRKWLLAGVHVA